MASAGFAMAWWLLSALPSLPNAAQKATARQGAIQTALALAAGIGAAITLMLAFRRQRHQEHAAHVTAYLTERNAHLAEQVAEHNRQDATERRVTELYTKAVEQLGHATAAVRLGGLYALERLAQDNPAHRQTIVNVICAYLRMPYTLPVPPEPVDPAWKRAEALRDAHRRYQALRAAARGRMVVPASPASAIDDSAAKDTEEERQVRLTAQRILIEHLRDGRDSKDRDTVPASRFWEGMRIDLTGATLINLDFTCCRTINAQFGRATFEGDAVFSEVTFGGDAVFSEVTFGGDAVFSEVTFKGKAVFSKANFEGDAWFSKATFEKMSEFNEATFEGNAEFSEATFKRDTEFRRATFKGKAVFSKANFEGDAWFIWANFEGDTWFNEANFEGDTWFNEANFEGDARFDRVRVLPGLKYIWPSDWMVVPQKDGSGLLQRDDAELSSSPSDPDKV